MAQDYAYLTRESDWDTDLYCLACGSDHVAVELWWSQHDDDVETPSEAAARKEGVCIECGANLMLRTLPELWEIWQDFSASHIKRDGTGNVIDREFLGFDEGTPVSDILHWFDARCPHSIAEDLTNAETTTISYKGRNWEAVEVTLFAGESNEMRTLVGTADLGDELAADMASSDPEIAQKAIYIDEMFCYFVTADEIKQPYSKIVATIQEQIEQD